MGLTKRQIYMRNYYRTHKKKMLAASHKWWAENSPYKREYTDEQKKKRSAYYRAYYKKYGEKMRAQMREYWQKKKLDKD